MSDSLTEILYDIKEYMELCRHFGETPVRDAAGPDPYCAHAIELRTRKFNEDHPQR